METANILPQEIKIIIYKKFEKTILHQSNIERETKSKFSTFDVFYNACGFKIWKKLRHSGVTFWNQHSYVSVKRYKVCFFFLQMRPWALRVHLEKSLCLWSFYFPKILNCQKFLNAQNTINVVFHIKTWLNKSISKNKTLLNDKPHFFKILSKIPVFFSGIVKNTSTTFSK